MIETDKARRALRLLPPIVIGLAAAVLLFWSLDAKYLWQDEANTAVLAVRMLRFGKPLAYDGVNFVGLDHFPMELLEPIEPRSHHPQDEVDYYIRHRYLKADTTWKWHPWGQFVATALSIRLLGQTHAGRSIAICSGESHYGPAALLAGSGVLRQHNDRKCGGGATDAQRLLDPACATVPVLVAFQSVSGVNLLVLRVLAAGR
jgi:hypothetical protein